MSEFIYLFIFLFCSMLRGGKGGDEFKILINNKKLLSCAGNLDVKCLDSHLADIIRKLSSRPEIVINDHFSVERFNDGKQGPEVKEEVGFMEDFWNLTFFKEWLRTRALKINLNGLVWRIFESRTSPNALEVSFEPDERIRALGEGKSERIYRVVIPLILGFKITGMLLFALVVIKFFLLKAVFLSNLALFVSGLVLFKKLYYYGMSMMAKYHYNNYLMSHEGGVNHYGGHEPDLSGYGYNNNESYEADRPNAEYKEASYFPESSLHDYAFSYPPSSPYYGYNAAMSALNRNSTRGTKKSWR